MVLPPVASPPTGLPTDQPSPFQPEPPRFSLPAPRFRLDRFGLPTFDDDGSPRYASGNPPTADKIRKVREQRREFWRRRNEEINKDLAVVYMEQAEDNKSGDPAGEEIIQRATGAAMVYKIAQMMSAQKDVIKVQPLRDAAPYLDAAQAIEDFLLDCRRHVDKKHTARGQPGYAFSEGWLAGATGWLVSREYLDLSRRWLIGSELYDPRCCYPEYSDDDYAQLSSMLYYEETTLRAFLGGNPRFQSHEAFSDLDDESVETDPDIKVCWYEDDQYSVIMVNDDEPVVERHGYGFCPWLMTAIGGSPLMDLRARPFHGMSVVRLLRPMLRYRDRLMSQAASEFALNANPTIVQTFDSSKFGREKPAEIKIGPGQRALQDTFKGESFQAYQANSRPDMLQYLQTAADQDLDDAGIPALKRGTLMAINNNFQFDALRQHAEFILQPMSKGIIAHREWQHRLWLQLILVAEREFLLDPMAGRDGDTATMGIAYTAPNRAPGATAYGSGAPRRTVQLLSPAAIHINGVESEVKLSHLTPQDIARNGQTAGMLVEMGVLDPETASELLGVFDWQEIYEKIIYHKYMMTPEVITEYSGPYVIERRDPRAAAFMEQKKAQNEQKEMMMAQMQAAGGQPPGGPPGGPPPGAPPAPSPGLSADVLPSQLQAGAGQPGADAEGLNQYIQALPSLAPEGA
jgi:hypothetical protein